MTRCHPAMEWAEMKAGRSLAEIASEYGDRLSDLDRALWNWRATHTESNPTRGTNGHAVQAV